MRSQKRTPFSRAPSQAGSQLRQTPDELTRGSQIPPEQEIASVTADGTFDTRKCHHTVAARAAAIIPPRKNAKPWKPDSLGAVVGKEILPTTKRVRQSIW